MAEHSSFNELIGSNLGKYRVERLLERNDMGPVFLASDNQARTTYALRFLMTPPGLTPEARLVALGRFQQEAIRVKVLQHPCILPLMDYGNYQGIPYIVLPHMAMVSLRASLAQQGPPDVAKVGHYLDQITGALEYAHQQGVLHRNLSTRCIFLKSDRQDGQIVLADFGLMRMREVIQQDTPAKHPYAGSSESSAPEQLLGKPVDTYTDIYALGAVLYRLLTGHPVFAGNTREEIERQHLYAPVPPLRMWRAGLPGGLDAVIAQAMAKEPALRFSSPGALAQAYHKAIAGRVMSDAAVRGQIPATPAVSPVPSTAAAPAAPELPQPAFQPAHSSHMGVGGPVPSPKQADVSRRRLVLAVGGGVGVVALGALGFYLVTSAKTSSTSTYAGSGTVNQPSSANNAGDGTQASTGGSGNPTQPSSTATATAAQPSGNVIARTSQVPVNSAVPFPIANHKNPGVLVHLPNDSFVAFDSTCTHAGCAVRYNPQSKLLECPCHGAIFDPAKNAAVVQGPAQTPLASVKITVDAQGNIIAAS